MSDEEIASGTRWNDEIGRSLEDTDFGIVCVTASNQHQPWLMFEAGALAKRLQTARVVPLRIDLPPAEVTGPLLAFQGRCLDREGMRKLIRDINSARDEPLADDQIDTLFDALWPKLEEQVNQAKAQAPKSDSPRRSNQDMLEELVERVRRIERNSSSPGGVGVPTVSVGDIVTLGDHKFVVRNKQDAKRLEPFLSGCASWKDPRASLSTSRRKSC
jgi:hypothetical protein